MFDDPYAAAFVAAYGDDAGGARPEPSPQRRALAFHVIIRTRYFDDYLLAAVGAGCRQVVLLAAGLDTRAFRLAWPVGTRLFELDLPELLDGKERVLSDAGARPSCVRAVLPVDLTGDWLPPLGAAGFDPDLPTAWLVEGLLVYLGPDDAARVLTTVTTASAAGSRIAFERGSGTRTVAAADTAAVTSLWRGGIDDPLSWLRAHGWDADEDDLAEVASSYGRPPSAVTASGFVRAVRT